MSPIKLWSSVFCLFSLVFTSSSWGNETYRLKFVRSLTHIIPEVEWDISPENQNPILKERDEKGPGSKYYVVLKGKFKIKDGNLLYQQMTVRVERDESFQIEVPIEGQKQEIVLTRVAVDGKTANEKATLEFPEWDLLNKPAMKQKKWSLSPGFGVTGATYQQSGVTNLVETLLTFKVSGSYRIKEVWDVGASMYVTALPFTSNMGSTVLRFIGVNVRGGYNFNKLLPATWLFSVQGGIYYASTFASDNARIGYRDVQGPQLYPVLRKSFKNGNSAWIYFKYSPIFDGSSFLRLNNAEFATGGGYSFTMLKKLNLAATLDIAMLSLQLSASTAVQSNTYTAGLAYYF